MVQQEGAPSVPELVELAGHKAHLERERALSRIEQLLEGAGGAAMQHGAGEKVLAAAGALPERAGEAYIYIERERERFDLIGK